RQRAVPSRDPVTSAYFRDIRAQTAMESDHVPPELPRRGFVEPAREAPPEAVAEIVDLLHEAGVIPRSPRALLEGAATSAPRLASIREALRVAHERDPDAYALRSAELAYLANVITAGSTIQSQPVAAEEAANAAAAVCNLGLENWPVHWLAAEDRRGLS